MKIIQSLLLKLLSLAVLTGGVVLLIKPLSELHDFAVNTLPPDDWLRYTAAVVVIAVGAIGLLPFSWRRRPRQISFSDPAGDLNIQLDAVEGSLNRALAKRRDVKRIAVRIIKETDPGKVRVTADCILYKDPDISARELLSDLRAAIRRGAYNMLGEDVVTTAEVNARRIIPREQPAELEEELPAALRKPSAAAPAAFKAPLAPAQPDYDTTDQPEPGPPSNEAATAGEAIPEAQADDTAQTTDAEEDYLYIESDSDNSEPEIEQPFISDASGENEPSSTAFLDLGDEEKEGPNP